MTTENCIILYGLAGEEEMYTPITYYKFFGGAPGTIEKKKKISDMRYDHPGIKLIYEIEDFPGLRRDYLNAQKWDHRALENRNLFKDLLNRYGIKVYDSKHPN